MVRQSGLGRGLSSLIPAEVEVGQAPTGATTLRGPARRSASSRTATSLAGTSTRSRWRRSPPSVRELGVLQPVLVRPLDGWTVRAHRRRAPLAGRAPGRPHPRPGARPGARRHRVARAGGRREPPPRRSRPPRGGGGLPAAHRGVRADPRAGGHPRRQEPGRHHERPAAVPAPAVDPEAPRRRPV